MEYNIHQDQLWYELGETLAAYINELTRVSTYPSSFLIIPTRIPFNSQKTEYREKLLQGLENSVEGDCRNHNYQISFWSSFSWRMKMPIFAADGTVRNGYLYGNNVDQRILFEDRPNTTLTMIEEVFMSEVFNLPLDNLDSEDYVDRFAGSMMQPLAEKTITIDHVHRYNDNRIRLDLIFDAMRYHLHFSVRRLDDKRIFPEVTLFVSD